MRGSEVGVVSWLWRVRTDLQSCPQAGGLRWVEAFLTLNKARGGLVFSLVEPLRSQSVSQDYSGSTTGVILWLARQTSRVAPFKAFPKKTHRARNKLSGCRKQLQNYTISLRRHKHQGQLAGGGEGGQLIRSKLLEDQHALGPPCATLFGPVFAPSKEQTQYTRGSLNFQLE